MTEHIPVYAFSPEKNLKLKRERNVSFEEIIAAIENGQLLDILEHTNPSKYNNQKIYVVFVSRYVYLVPFVQTKDEIFLKTIIPSRKANKKYNKNEAS